MSLPSIDESYLQNTLVALLATPSPTGYSEAAARQIETMLQELGLAHRRNRKDAIIAELPGPAETAPKAMAGCN